MFIVCTIKYKKAILKNGKMNKHRSNSPTDQNRLQENSLIQPLKSVLKIKAFRIFAKKG